jgi:hypothetical protein
MARNEPETAIRPFEWLTSASSLKSLLPPGDEIKLALHVGCGSSTLGEYLVEEMGYHQVVNVDKDGPTLKQMQERWQRRFAEDVRLKFCKVDLASERIPFPYGYFDVVLDKSTLDCTLCSDEATAGLLCGVYASLRPNYGVYVVISFHHVDMLLPLLRDCPGTDWVVTHHVIPREVEDIIGNNAEKNRMIHSEPEPRLSSNGESAWSTGSFQPTEDYRRTVNVMICQRQAGLEVELDREKVRLHIHETNDEWFRQTNPMLTRTRHDELQRTFQERSLDLRMCYSVLFTAAEREHLTYDYFLEDWRAFMENRPNLTRETMSFETAVAFLNEMQ